MPNEMRKVPLGSSGVRVSAVCLGAMFLGTKTDTEASHAILDHYVESGGTFIDTANIYAHWINGFQGGESETVLGEWMRKRGNRSHLFLASKVGFQYPLVQRGLSASTIEAECEKSLKRLGTDTIDLFYAHVDDRNTPLEETLEAFNRLVRSGKVRLVGASNFPAWRLAEARMIARDRSLAEYCCIQQRFSYLQPKPGASFDPQLAANAELLDFCASRGLTLLAYSPLLGGAYTRADRTIPQQYLWRDTEDRLARLKRLARELEVTANQLVLAWLMQSRPASIPVMAGGTVEQVEENLGALGITLSEDQVSFLSKGNGAPA
ncbi:MAG TPA: aldo/keto reductase, partial [Spirochaetia bacterium]|nr:aldo/keto reductase [Spirochaetia bacterium]